MKVVIVGGGFGGVKTALELSRLGGFEITLISERPDFRYYPALYRSATGHSHLESSIPLSDIFDGVPNVTAVCDTVTKVDPKKKIITGRAGTYHYSAAVLALGVITNYFGINGLEEYAYGIKSLDEAEEFKRHLHEELLSERRPDMNYVVVGGGPTGVELAAALSFYLKRITAEHGIAARKLNISVVEAAPRLLQVLRVLEEELSHDR